MIRAVLFDLDGTLLDHDASIRSFVAAQHGRLAKSLRHIPFQEYLTRWITLDCRGHVWKDRVYQELVSEFAITDIGWQELLSDYETHFMQHCVAFPGLVAMLTDLRQQEYALGIITNGRGAFQLRAIQGLGVADFFDAILVSEVEQVRKPQSDIFHRALERVNAPASAAVFVGDHPEPDIDGARGAGLKAIWKRNPFFPGPGNADCVIDDLCELPGLIHCL